MEFLTRADVALRQIAALTFVCSACTADLAISQELPRKRDAKPVCAIIDAADLAVTPILEASLLEKPELTWVERTEIARVLAEQELQAAFGAEGGARRCALGQLLKADVLILLRTKPNAEKWGPELIDCVVCETRQGLRLRAFTLASDKDLESVANALERTVEEALEKHQQRIEAIVAVPPFLSEDLDFQNNHLQVAYATLVEQRLLDQPGLIIVELAEAQAIAREISLAAPGAGVARQKLPLYVFGRYRHDGDRNERRLRMSLRLVRGETQVTLKGIKDLPPADAAAWIVKKTNELSRHILNAPSVVNVSPDVEAKQLESRAREFQRVGNWAEAYTLYEATLLLKDDQELRNQALIVTRNYVLSEWRPHADQKRAQRVVALYERGLEHLEQFLRTAEDLSKFQAGGKSFDWFFDVHVFAHVNQMESDRDVKDLVSDVRRRRTETYLRIAKMRSDAGHTDINRPWEGMALELLSDEEQFATILRMANQWKDRPDVQDAIVGMAQAVRLTLRNVQSWENFLTQLARVSPDASAAAAIIKERIEGIRKQLVAEVERKPAARTTVDPAIKSIKFVPAAGETWPAQDVANLEGSMPLNNGADLFWSFKQIFVMQKPGELQLIFENKGPDRFYVPFYDGRYVWLPFFEAGYIPQLLAIDPVSKQIVRFTADDGLPLPPREPGTDTRDIFHGAAVAPGHVCVVGYMGRTWIANVFLSPDGEKRIDVFHEAREAGKKDDRAVDDNPKVAFRPSFMHAIRGDGQKECRILLGRGQTELGVYFRKPLVIDPHAGTVKIGNYQLEGNMQRDHIISDERAIYCRRGNQEHVPTLMRIAYPAENNEPLVVDIPPGHLVRAGDQVEIVGKKWWSCNLDNQTTETRIEHVAWLHRTGGAEPKIDARDGAILRCAMPSNHFGPAAVVGVEGGMAWYYLDSLAAPTTSSALALIKDPVQQGDLPKAAEAEHKPLVLPPADPAIKPIPFNVAGEDPANKFSALQFEGAMPLRDGADMFWSRKLFLMEQPGQLRPVYGKRISNDLYASQAFDGRYFWLALFEEGSIPLLLAFDTLNEQVVRFTAEDGFPSEPKEEGKDWNTLMRVAAVAPGHICFARYHAGRTWIANVFLNEKGEKRIDVFHEAAEAPNGKDATQEMNPNVAFEPSFMYPVRGNGEKECRILLGRLSHYSLRSNPMVIDPHARTAKIGDYVLPGLVPPSRMASDNRVVYSMAEGGPRGPKLLRIRYPAERMETFMDDMPGGRIVVEEGQLHIIGKKWWACDLTTKKIETLANDLPWFYYTEFPTLGYDFADERAFQPGKGIDHLAGLVQTHHFGVAVGTHSQMGRQWYYLDRASQASK